MKDIAYLTCVTCGKEYKGCRYCEEAKKNGRFMWRQSCDTTECFQVLLIVSDFYYGKISKKDAKQRITPLLTEDMKPYHESARGTIGQIMAEDPAPAPSPKTEAANNRKPTVDGKTK